MLKNLLVVAILCLLAHNSYASSYVIKSYTTGNTYYDFATGSGFTTLRNDLLDPANFGPAGTVSDVRFTDILGVTYITDTEIMGADIFVAFFPYAVNETITSTEAQVLKDFVNSGGSLIVVTDASVASASNASLIGTEFGGVSFFGGWAYTSGSDSIIDRSTAPEVTNGPFGTVNTYSWSSDASSKIISTGDATILDDHSLIGVINPTISSGSVYFLSDLDLFDFDPSQASIDESPKASALNVFSYSAHSSKFNVVPEPVSIILMLTTIVGLMIKKRIK